MDLRELSDLKHHAVIHPKALLATEQRAAARINEWAASHLAVVFGAVWTVWVFFIWPLLAQFFSPLVQTKTSYYAQSWIQLFALPLFVWVGNRLQKSADAQSDAQHQALTHIAVTGDDVKTLLAQNTELTKEVKDLAAETHHLTVQHRLEPDALSLLAADVRAVRTAAGDAHAEAKACREELRALVVSVTALLRDPPAPATAASPPPAGGPGTSGSKM